MLLMSSPCPKPYDSAFIGRRNFIKRTAFVGAAVVAPGLAANAERSSENLMPQTPNELSADEVRNLLKLEPHATCGFVRVTFMSKERIAPGGLPAPFAAGRWHDRTRCGWAGPAPQAVGAAPDSRQYVPYCPCDRTSPLVPRCEHRMARR